MGRIAAQASNTSIQQAKPQNGIQKLLSDNWGRIEDVMPKHMSSERLYQLSVSSINQTPRLAECTPASLLSCVMKCSALGLEPSAVDGLGRAYIIPFHNKKTGHYEATFILGYKGLIDLARNSGQIVSISARAVYKGDDFAYSYGLEDKLVHNPKDACEKVPENLEYVYVVARFKDGGYQFDVMSKPEIDNIRKHSKAANSGPWVDWYESMALKTVIRKASKTWPMSVVQEAVAADETSGGEFSTFFDTPLIEDAVEDVPTEQPKAVCGHCGNVVDTSPDATMQDLNEAEKCCDAPDYQEVK